MNPMKFYQDEDYYLNYNNMNYNNMSEGWYAAFIILILAIMFLTFRNNLIKSGPNTNENPNINNGVAEYWYSDIAEPAKHSSGSINKPSPRKAEVTDKTWVNTNSKNFKKTKSLFNTFFLWI